MTCHPKKCEILMTSYSMTVHVYGRINFKNIWRCPICLLEKQVHKREFNLCIQFIKVSNCIGSANNYKDGIMFITNTEDDGSVNLYHR